MSHQIELFLQSRVFIFSFLILLLISVFLFVKYVFLNDEKYDLVDVVFFTGAIYIPSVILLYPIMTILIF